MKNLFLTMTIICSIMISACNSDETISTSHTGETYMSDYTSVTLEESTQNKYVTATVILLESLENASLWIDNVQVGTFENNSLTYEPSTFGEVDCIIVHDDGELSDTLELYIETSFIQYNSSGENGDTKDPVEGGEVILTPYNVTFGSNDVIWAYDLRIPKDGSISFDYITSLLSGSTELEVHFRLDDYADRADLYPDCAYPAQYIDAETDKWIDSPAKLTHGIYTLYVCPNFISDKTYISIIHSSDFSSGTFSANYRSITEWPE